MLLAVCNCVQVFFLFLSRCWKLLCHCFVVRISMPQFATRPTSWVRVWGRPMLYGARGIPPVVAPRTGGFPRSREQKPRKFPPDSQTSFLHTTPACFFLLKDWEPDVWPRVILPLYFPFQEFANIQRPANSKGQASTWRPWATGVIFPGLLFAWYQVPWC